MQLSSVSRQRYIKKLTKVGLSNDPYCLESPEWEKDPENLPSLSWSNIMMFMVSTPSPYTKESIKVVKQFFFIVKANLHKSIGMERNAGFRRLCFSWMGARFGLAFLSVTLPEEIPG